MKNLILCESHYWLFVCVSDWLGESKINTLSILLASTVIFYAYMLLVWCAAAAPCYVWHINRYQTYANANVWRGGAGVCVCVP